MIPFGKYILLDRIAVGGMAEVYTAKSFGIEGFEKIIAIKRILPTMAEDHDFISMFIDEAKIAGHLTHANIVPIYELGKIGESHYIAMEYVWGKDLLQIMNRFRRMRRHMPPVMAAWIASKMLEGLDYAHRKRDRHGRPMGIIHRDVSPQNCLVSYEGQIKLIDFGIAKAASRNTKTQAGVLKGKFGYMSPEQVRGLPIDHRSDIFAASTCLHEMLTGERLFVGESDFSTLEKVRNAAVAPPSQMVADLPKDLEDIVLKGLAREPDERWQTAGEMQEELQRFIALQRPPFGTSKLNTWMRTAFAPEIAKEKGRLDSFNKVAHPAPTATVPPRVPSLGTTSPQNPAALRPPPAAPPGGTEELDLPEFEDEMPGEATMISSSPFDELEEKRAREMEELTEEPTQIFFTADDLEEIEEVRPTPAGPAGGLGAIPKAPPAATFPKPRPVGTPPSVQVSPSIPAAPAALPPPGPGPQASPFKSTLALTQDQLPAPPPQPEMSGAQPLDPGGFGGQQAFAQPPPAQRNLHTVEVRASEAKRKSGAGKWIALLAVGALLIAGLSVGAAYLAFGGEETGSISIRVSPETADARVFVDGVMRGRAPLLLEHVPAGEHEIEVRAEGYASASRSVPVSGGTSMLEIAISPEGPLVAAATPPPTQVAAPGEPAVIANQLVAPTPAPEPTPEPVAEPTPEPTPEPAPVAAPVAPTPAPAAEPPAPEPARPARPAATETPARPRPVRTAEEPSRPRPVRVPQPTAPERPTRAAGGNTGTLTINTVPWARVFIDGRDTGRNTPVRDLRVPAGSHTIGLRTNDGTMHNVQVTVEAGGSQRVVRQL
ncbi:MAG: protein kinase [Sandaracinaceae bacterium]